MKKHHGFTLIEVLLALSIVAIAFAALLKATTSDIVNTERLRNKTLAHWVAMQGLSMIQLATITINNHETITEKSSILDRSFYWRATLSDTDLAHVQRIDIQISQSASGPFLPELIGYRYHA